MPILDHIGDAGRGPGIVLQHPEVAVLVADDVDAADMDIGPEADREAFHLGPVIGVAEDQLGRNNSVADDAAFMIDIMQEAVNGGDSLLHAGLKLPPFGRGDDPRNTIEWKNSIDGIASE